MKKLNRFLDDNNWLCWLLRLVFIFVWLNGIGLFRGIGSWWVQERKDFAATTAIDYRQRHLELKSYIAQLEAKARAKGIYYGPKEYFDDLLSIDHKTVELKVGRYLMTNLTNMLEVNRMAGRFSQQDLARERDRFTSLSPFHQPKPAQSGSGDGIALLRWLIHAYLLALILWIPTYLLRMREDKGIAATILAEKLKFALAILIWPLYFYRYPGDMIREIVVEAELRRLRGKLWLGFGKLERSEIKRIANSDGYHAWRIQFREQNAGRFQHRLITALLVTVLFMVLGPVFAQSKPIRNASAPSGVTAVARAGPILCQADDGVSSSVTHPQGLPIRVIEFPSPSAENLRVDTPLLDRQRLAQRIDHIPLPGLSVCMLVAN